MTQIPSIYNRNPNRILLAVDRNRQVHQMIVHAFRDCFDSIYTATLITETEMILRNFPITHLLCELDMDELNQGLTLTAQWRRMYPDITRACIFSGRVGSMRLPEHVDGLHFKGDPMTGLKSLLLPTEYNTDEDGTRVGGNQ